MLRLGNLKGEVNDVMAHSWFKDIDWEAMRNLKIKPPPLKLSQVNRSNTRHNELFVEYILYIFSLGAGDANWVGNTMLEGFNRF